MLRVLLIIHLSLLHAIYALDNPVEKQPTHELESRLETIDSRLEELANLTLRSGFGPIGYRSYAQEYPSQSTWVEVDLETAAPINEIVLVPVVWRDMNRGFLADGFPKAFRILDEDGKLLAETTIPEDQLTRIAPLIIPINGQRASRIRIQVTEPSARALDGYYLFQLSELMVFSGGRNLALRKPVNTPTAPPEGGIGWDKHFLTDGTVPYLMNSGQGKESFAFISPFDHYSDTPVNAPLPLHLTIDLGEVLPVSAIHIHAIDQGDMVPQAAPGDIGIPKHLLIQGSTSSDFSNPTLLLDFQNTSIYGSSPIMMWNIPETECRYVRFIAKDPYLYRKNGLSGPRIGFAELEVFANGQNVAAAKSIKSNAEPLNMRRRLSALTDGHNLYGQLLPIRDWMHQLSERHDLENERPTILGELNTRAERYKTYLHRILILAAILLAVAIIIALIQRNARQRSIFRIRTRIAADLHDELGANLHAIGMLGDLVEKSQNSPERLKKLLNSMRSITERTGRATSFCVNMLEDEERYSDLAENLRRTADRLTADLDHELIFEGEGYFKELSAQKRIDLFLFYKECLINIRRHSGATQIRSCFVVTPKHLLLTIDDNGSGLDEEVPASLKRRARLLRAKVQALPQSPHGTRIQLSLRLRTLYNPFT